jgi:hypothetical protein
MAEVQPKQTGGRLSHAPINELLVGLALLVLACSSILLT